MSTNVELTLFKDSKTKELLDPCTIPFGSSEPQVQLDIEIRNKSQWSETYEIKVDSDDIDEQWICLSEEKLESVESGQPEIVEITIQWDPNHPLSAGEKTVKFIVTPNEGSAESLELKLDVEAMHTIELSVDRNEETGQKEGRYTVEVTHDGNADATALLKAIELTEEGLPKKEAEWGCDYNFTKEELSLHPEDKDETTLTVTAKTPLFFAPTRTFQFKVEVTVDETVKDSVTCTWIQQRAWPPWLIAAAFVALAAILAIVLFALFRPPVPDQDGMPIAWEETYGLDPARDDSGEDPDGDGLTNGQEFKRDTNPIQADSDGDGYSDGQEIEMGMNPLGHNPSPDVYFTQGMEQFSNGKFNEAIEQFNQAERLHQAHDTGLEQPELFKLFYHRAASCQQLEFRSSTYDCSPQRVVNDYTQAIDLYKETGEGEEAVWAYMNCGIVYYTQMNDDEKGLENLDQAIRLAPEDANPYFHRGVYHLRHEEWQALVDDMTQAINFNPEWPDLYGHRGHGFVALEKFPEAIADYKIFTDLTDNDPLYLDWRNGVLGWEANYHFKQGQSRLDKEEFSEAIAAFDQAQELGLESPELFYYRAVSWKELVAGKPWMSDEYGRILRDFAQAIELYKENGEEEESVWAYINRGIFYYTQMNDNARGLEDLDQAVRLAPKDANPYFHRGIYHLRHEEWQALVDDMTQAIKFNPEWPDLYGHRGRGYIELEKTDKATTDYEEFIRLTQDNELYDDWRNDVLRWLDPDDDDDGQLD